MHDHALKIGAFVNKGGKTIFRNSARAALLVRNTQISPEKMLTLRRSFGLF